MQHLIEVLFKLSANILVATTCIVIIYGVFLLAHLMEKTFKGEKILKAKMKFGQQEVLLEEEIISQQKRMKWHKLFWSLIGIAYLVGFGLVFLPIILLFLIIYVVFKIGVKVRRYFQTDLYFREESYYES